MMPSDFIVEVNEADFEHQVLAYSHQIPVVVDFWAEWCAPCRVLGPILESLANEAGGSFRLAKINVDHNPKLASRYDVRSIPVVKTIKDGVVVAEFVGAQPEDRIREYLREVVPSPGDLLLEKAWSIFQMGQTTNAEEAFRQVLDQSPGSSSALLGLAKILLIQGNGQEAHQILVHFPVSRELASAEQLRPLADALARYDEDMIFPDDPLEAAFQNSLRLVRLGNIEAALDGLLDVLRQDKHYRGEETRLVLLGLLELLEKNELMTRQYRNELASILF